MEGMWYYVGTFDHRADYLCLLCPDYKPEEAIYRISFLPGSKLNSAINFMRGEASFSLANIKELDNGFFADFSLKNYRELNKPIETIEDGIFRSHLLKSTEIAYYELSQKGFDASLQLQFDQNQYLYFVRKS